MKKLFMILFFLISSCFLSAVVIIDYTYVVTQNTTINDDVHVLSTGSITNGNASYALTVNGSIINEGSISNSSYYLTMRVTGNITNSGVWTCYHTYLDGTSAQHLTLQNGTVFGGYNFTNNNPSSIIADSDLSFVNSRVNFQNLGSFDFSAGWDLYLNGQRLSDVTLIGSTDPNLPTVLNLSNNAYFDDFTASNVTLDGVAQFASDCTITGNLINNGTLRNYGSASYTITIDCDVENNGSIENNSYYLYTNCNGNLINNGTWSNYKIELNGNIEQHISCGSGNVFSVSYFNCGNANNIIADSDLSFVDTRLNFYNLGSFDFSGDWDLSISGYYLENCTLLGSSTVGSTVLTLSGGAYLDDFNGSNLTLNGVVAVASDCLFSGYLINNGTFRNHNAASYTTIIDCDFINNGTIQNGSYYLTTDIVGNIENNGIWENYRINLTGTSDQHVSCASGSSFVIDYFNANSNLGNLYLDSDMEFISTMIDLNSNNLILQSGNILTINGDYIHDGSIEGNNAILNLISNAYLNDLFIADIELLGICQISSNVVFNGLLLLNGTLQNYQSYSYTVTINDGITNNGVIQDNPNGYSLTTDIAGDLINHGAWTNYRVNLEGTTDPHITFAAGTIFDLDYFYASSTTDSVYFETSISFLSTRIDLNGNTVIMPADSLFSVDGNYLTDGAVLGNGSVFEMLNNAYVHNVDFDSVELQGICQIGDNNVVFNGPLLVTGTLQNYSNYLYTVTINDGITNNGVIRDNPNGYSLTTDIAGNIVNNGAWNNYKLQLTGSIDSHIIFASGTSFDLDYFYASTTTSNIYFDSNMSFNSTMIDLNSNTVIMQSGSLLSINSDYLHDGSISANNSIFEALNGAYVYDLEFDTIELQGTCQIADNNVNFYGPTVLTGILQNKSSYQYDVNFYGDLTNNGTIRNNPNGYNLTTNINGNIINNGVWENYRLDLNGSTDQHLICPTGSNFDLDYFYANNPTRNIIFDSSIQFISTNIDLNQNTIILQYGDTFTVNGNYLREGYISGNDAVLQMLNNAYIDDFSLSDLEIQGVCQIADNSCGFYGDITLAGSLYNRNSYNYTLNIYGNLINNGIIQNNPVSYNLTLYCSGNVKNNGLWTNYRTYFNGTTDQYITLDTGFEIAGDVRFVSDITGSSYHWYFDDVILDNVDFLGENTSSLNWEVPLPSGYLGTFYCDVAGTSSRNIIVQLPITAEFEADVLAGTTPFTVNFIDLSIGEPVSWEWDFENDGTIDSYDQNPQWIYYTRGDYTVSLIASNGATQDTETKSNYITLLNSSPFISNPIIDFSFAEDTIDNSLDLNNVFDDSDLLFGDSFTFSYSGNTNIGVDIVAGIVTVTPIDDWFGSEIITFTATDDQNAFISDEVIITVDPVNDPPILDITGVLEADEDLPSQTYDFSQFCSQTWGETDALSLTADNSPHINVTINGFDVVFETNTPNWFGTEDITFHLDDNVAETSSRNKKRISANQNHDSRDLVSQTISITINPINDPPILNITGTFEADEDLPSQTYDFAQFCSQTWGETDVLTLSALNSDHIDVSINDFNVMFESNTPNWNGTESVTFYLDDNVSESSRDVVEQIIQVTINPVNDPPSIVLPDDFSFDEDNDLLVDFSTLISDIEPDNLTLSVTGNTEIIVQIAGTDVTFSAPSDWFGSETLTFTVDDNVTDATASDFVEVIVVPVNDPPILNITGTFEADEDLPSQTYDFAQFCSQTWGETDILTLTTLNSDHIDVSINDFNVVFESNTPNWYGTENVTFYLDDNVTESSRSRDIVEQTIQVTINAVNDPPSIVLPDDFTFEEDNELLVDFSTLISDIEPDNLTLSVTGNTEIIVQIDGTDVTFSAPSNWFGSETLTFTVDDNVTDATASDDVEVVVTAVNDEPVLISYFPPELSFTVVQDSSITFNVEAEDIDSDLYFEWYVNGMLQTETSESFTHFFDVIGSIFILSVISDGEYEIETGWEVNVESGSGSSNLISLNSQLYQNHPNPFNPTTTILFELNTETTENTELVIFNMKGQKIIQLVDEALPAGKYSVFWDGKDEAGKQVSSGIYLYRMITKDYSAIKKMIMLK